MCGAAFQSGDTRPPCWGMISAGSSESRSGKIPAPTSRMRYQGQGLTVQMKLSTLEGRTGELQVTVSGSATRWRLRRTEAGLRLGLVRAFGTDQFTWADLLRVPLSGAQVYALYFPSRFDLPVDGAVEESLRIFGDTTSNRTSVDFWDARDEHFSEALELFGLRNPPALVLATGLEAPPSDADTGWPPDSLYCISFADQAILADRQQLAGGVNIAHEILMRCDSKEIASYVRQRKIKALLGAIGRGAGAVRDELVKLHPKFGLPGGLSVELG
jgi:hypothetical protein